jgi:hypothetical protein
MKTISIILFIISSAFISGPKEIIYISNWESFEEVIGANSACVWIEAPLVNSFETKILAQMAEQERWEKLKAWRPLSAHEYREILSRNGRTSSHQEIHRLSLEGPLLKAWLREDLAVQLGLDPIEGAAFADEFLSHLCLPGGVYRKLLIQVQKIQ